MGKKLDYVNWEEEFPQVPECVHRAVQDAGDIILQKKQGRKKNRSKRGVILLVACLTLLSGMTVFAASSLWQQRMESMNRKEVEEYYLSIAGSGAPAFRYSRAFFKEEEAEFEQLFVAYEEGGVFPEGCVTMLSERKEYKGRGVGFEPISSTFFLPEERLSEEELLQLVDFYHKADYALQKVVQEEEEMTIEPIAVETEPPVIEEVKKPVIMQEFMPLNDMLEYYQFTISTEEYVQEIAVGTEYMYMGDKKQILRMPVGTDEAECIYTFGEEASLFALDADKEDNLYVSVREYVAETDNYRNRLIKLSADGESILEYDVEAAKYGDEISLNDHIAYKMLPGEDGRLYVKDRWLNRLCVYVFDAAGEFEGVIVDKNIEVHPAGSMCRTEEGSIYVLGMEEIILLDTEHMCVAETYAYTAPEMAAAVDILYPMGADSFYLLSYDGLFVTTLGEGSSTQILAPFELDIFSDGMRRYPVSEDTLVVANYADPGVKVTYLRMVETH